VRYVSTRGKTPPAGLAEAVLSGLAPDGGLYVPERLDRLPEPVLAGLRGLDLAGLAAAVTAPFLEADVPEDERRRIAAEALDFDIPLVPLAPGIHVLELFHGPTLAFKDVGARFMARLMAWFRRGADRPLTVLVATSGDTGSAVAHAFLGLPGVRVAVLYPKGRVSALQESQFTTLGGNVQALAVEGSFDDCQRMTKEAFADAGLRARLALTSANSINVGRLVPQTIYYFRAASLLPEGAPPPLFSTPSGNYGNLTAGLMAARLGLACAGFVAATNVNDVVPEYLSTGRFAPRPSVATISSAMDVGNPSNFDRVLALFDGDRDALRRVVRGSRHDDAETRRAIREVHDRHGTVLDPHTAVGYLGLRGALAEPGGPRSGILLATAHPAKFREHVEPIIGRKVPLPDRLAACLDRPSAARPLAAETRALRDFLLGWA
jgi:threonine synthase